MATAVRIQKLNSGGTPTVSIDFQQYEVIGSKVQAAQKSRVDRAQTGQPTMILLGPQKTDVLVDLRIHGDDTSGKLTILRNAAKSGTKFRIYPGYQDNPTEYYDGIIPTEIPLYWFFAGHYEAGQIYRLIFREKG